MANAGAELEAAWCELVATAAVCMDLLLCGLAVVRYDPATDALTRVEPSLEELEALVARRRQAHERAKQWQPPETGEGETRTYQRVRPPFGTLPNPG